MESQGEAPGGKRLTASRGEDGLSKTFQNSNTQRFYYRHRIKQQILGTLHKSEITAPSKIKMPGRILGSEVINSSK